MELIIGNPKITMREMAKEIGLTNKGVEWRIARLKKDGIIKRVGPTKRGKWEVVKKKT